LAGLQAYDGSFFSYASGDVRHERKDVDVQLLDEEEDLSFTLQRTESKLPTSYTITCLHSTFSLVSLFDSDEKKNNCRR
jgi:hypothetical protein